MCGFYDQLILEHARTPGRCGHLEAPTSVCRRSNKLCGDEVTVELRLSDGTIEEYAFTAEGCAISIASASILGDRVQGMTVRDALANISLLRELVRSDSAAEVGPELAVLADIRKLPGRKNCVLLAWDALEAAILS